MASISTNRDFAKLGVIVAISGAILLFMLEKTTDGADVLKTIHQMLNFNISALIAILSFVAGVYGGAVLLFMKEPISFKGKVLAAPINKESESSEPYEGAGIDVFFSNIVLILLAIAVLVVGYFVVTTAWPVFVFLGVLVLLGLAAHIRVF